ncbi:MAG: palindromic element RPE4 domain-containing protein [Rickettsia endosymbiont of Argas persicus]
MDRFPIVIPQLDRGIQFKISKLLIFLVVFLDTVVKPRYDTEHIFRSTQQCLHRMTPKTTFDPRKNAYFYNIFQY